MSGRHLSVDGTAVSVLRSKRWRRGGAPWRYGEGQPPHTLPRPGSRNGTAQRLRWPDVLIHGWAGRGTQPGDRDPCSLPCGGTRRRPLRRPTQPSTHVLRVGCPERVDVAGKAPRFAERFSCCRDGPNLHVRRRTFALRSLPASMPNSDWAVWLGGRRQAAGGGNSRVMRKCESSGSRTRWAPRARGSSPDEQES